MIEKTKLQIWWSKHKKMMYVVEFGVAISIGILQSVLLNSPVKEGVLFGLLYSIPIIGSDMQDR